jgi:hypothetical protein
LPRVPCVVVVWGRTKTIGLFRTVVLESRKDVRREWRHSALFQSTWSRNWQAVTYYSQWIRCCCCTCWAGTQVAYLRNEF